MNTLLLYLLLVLQPVGGAVSPIRNLMPSCAATSGACPSNGYFCLQDNAIWRCATPRTWTQTAGDGVIAFGSTLPSTCSVGTLFLKTNNSSGQQLYACESSNTWAQQAGGGAATGLDGLTDVVISSVASADILVRGASVWANKAVSGDLTCTTEGVFTIGADKVALTTDTTGSYVSSATTNGGLTLTGTEGASLGMLATCASGEILKWNGTAWACATDAGAAAGSSDVGTVGTCTVDPCFTGTVTGATEALFWEGTADAFETALTAIDPTADRTVALPNESGTICTTGSVCTGYQSVLTNIAGLEAALTGTPNVIIATEIDTLSELDAIVANAVLVDEAGTNTLSGVKTFTATPIIQTATPYLALKDTQATDLDENIRLLGNCTTVTSGAETCDFSILQQSAGSLQTRVILDGDGDILIDGYRDVVQLRVQGHSTQTSDVFRVEDSTQDDLMRVTTGGVIVGDVGGDGNYGIEFVDNSSTVCNPASGSTCFGTIGAEIYVRDTGTSAIKIPKTQTTTCILENLAAGDDNYPCGGVPPYAFTITGVGCRCRTACTTPATIKLEDQGGTAVASSDVTCVSSPTVISYTAPSGGTATFISGEGVQFDTTNSPTANGIYEISYTWTAN